MGRCQTCEFSIKDKERDEAVGCEVCKKINLNYMYLGNNGLCPYYNEVKQWEGMGI
jgi:hypothetical protein